MSGAGAEPRRDGVREIVVHERIGELRAALFDRDRIVDLRLERWSDHETRVRWGQRFTGRVLGVDPRLQGAFVDLGAGGLPAFCPFGRERPEALRDGQAVRVRCVREADPVNEPDKGPVVVLEGAAAAGSDIGLAEDVPPWAGWPGEPREASPEEAERIDAAVEAVLSPDVPVPGGGRLTIETTRALVAIDVDSHGRAGGGGDAARFARALNLAAVPEIVRQVRLRGLAGLICVDFAGPRKKGDPEAVFRALASAFDAERNGGVEAPKTEVLALSKFGIAEIARQKRRPPLAARLLGPDGRPSGETLALDGLALLARDLMAARGRTVTLSAPPAAHAFLLADAIGWRDEIAGRIGGLYRLAPPDPALASCRTSLS